MSGVLATLTPANLALAAAIWMGFSALRRAEIYGPSGGRAMSIAAMILGAISLLLFGLFCYSKYF